MKTERLTLLTTPEFKAGLASQARAQGISVSELVRARCEQRPEDDEASLNELIVELRGSIKTAKKSLSEGIKEAESVLSALRAKNADRRAAPTRVKVTA